MSQNLKASSCLALCKQGREKPLLPAAAAFTLLEVLLAITITGFVLAAASTMVVSVSNIWSSRQERTFFEDHVDGVTEFIHSCFARAGTEIAFSDSKTPDTDNQTNENPGDGGAVIKLPPPGSGDSSGRKGGSKTNDNDSGGNSLLRRSEDPVGWAKPPGFAGYRDPLINFKLQKTPPLLINMDNAPSMGIDAFLYFDRDDGLSLLWYSILQEEAEDENDLRRTQISPYVKEIHYIYWDERFENWEEEDEPQEGEKDEYLLPRFIKLVFEKDDVVEERTVPIPVPSQSAILF